MKTSHLQYFNVSLIKTSIYEYKNTEMSENIFHQGQCDTFDVH